MTYYLLGYLCIDLLEVEAKGHEHMVEAMEHEHLSLVPRPSFPTAADGLHHPYVKVGLVHRSNFFLLILDFGEPIKLQPVVTSRCYLITSVNASHNEFE